MFDGYPCSVVRNVAARGIRLGHRRAHDLRSVDAEQVRRPDAVDVNIAEAPAAANHGAGREGVSDSDSRPEIVLVSIHQRSIGIGRLDHADGLRIEVGQHVVGFVHRRCVLVAQADVQRQLVVHADVVLHVEEVQVLPHLRDQERADRIVRAQAEHEVGKVVTARSPRRRPGA